MGYIMPSMAKNKPLAVGARNKGTLNQRGKGTAKIKFIAQLVQVQSSRRGSRLVLSVPDEYSDQVNSIMPAMLPNAVLDISAMIKQIPQKSEKKKGNQEPKRRVRRSRFGVYKD